MAIIIIITVILFVVIIIIITTTISISTAFYCGIQVKVSSLKIVI